MPFDACVQPRGFDHLIGINRISFQQLEDYKEAQLDRFTHQYGTPADIQNRVGFAIFLACVIPGAATGGCFGFIHPALTIMAAVGMVIGGVVAGGIVSNLKITTHLWWRDTTLDFPSDKLPGIVAEKAAMVQQMVPGTRFILGELMEHKEVIDPYLIAMAPDCSRLVIAMWEGHGEGLKIHAII